MKQIFKIASAVSLLAIASATPSQSQYGYFSFQVCNNSHWDADVAVHGKNHPGSSWEAEGWYRVHRGTCKTLGTWAQGDFDTYAEAINSGGRRWDGTTGNASINLCLTYPGPFRRVNYNGYACGYNEQLRLMVGHRVYSASHIWNLGN